MLIRKKLNWNAVTSKNLFYSIFWTIRVNTRNKLSTLLNDLFVNVWKTKKRLDSSVPVEFRVRGPISICHFIIITGFLLEAHFVTTRVTFTTLSRCQVAWKGWFCVLHNYTRRFYLTYNIYTLWLPINCRCVKTTSLLLFDWKEQCDLDLNWFGNGLQLQTI